MNIAVMHDHRQQSPRIDPQKIVAEVLVGHQVEGHAADRLDSTDLASEDPGPDGELGDEVADAEEGVTRGGTHDAPSVTSRSA